MAIEGKGKEINRREAIGILAAASAAGVMLACGGGQSTATTGTTSSGTSGSSGTGNTACILTPI